MPTPTHQPAAPGTRPEPADQPERDGWPAPADRPEPADRSEPDGWPTHAGWPGPGVTPPPGAPGAPAAEPSVPGGGASPSGGSWFAGPQGRPAHADAAGPATAPAPASEPVVGPVPVGAESVVGPVPVGSESAVGPAPIGAEPVVGPVSVGAEPVVGPIPVGVEPVGGQDPLPAAGRAAAPAGPAAPPGEPAGRAEDGTPSAPDAPGALGTPDAPDAPDALGTPGTPEGLAAARRFGDLVERLETGELVCPLPGIGRTRERFAVLSAVAEEDLSAARLFEGHVDAVAILAELGGLAVRPGERWGVWAAEPPGTGLLAMRDGDGWHLSGRKAYCSGAHTLTHALVTATASDGRRLFAVRLGSGCRPVQDSWQAIGMAGSDSPDVRFDNVPAEPVGDVAAYLTRPGFQHGGIGVAACWYGGARAVARVLLEDTGRGPDPLTDAHRGAVDVALHAARAALAEAADGIDADPADTEATARLRSLRTRAVVEAACADVLTHVGRATGAGPLCHDPRHARTVADLEVYVRQHHAERNLAELGRLVTTGQPS